MSSNADEINTLNTLKELLLKTEKEQILRIEKRLDDPMVKAKEISQSLPEAISLSVLDNNKLSRVIQPVIDDAIKVSVQKNPKALAEALFPVLGPGIRRAISSTIMGMIQSLNQMLNHSFSIQGMKWRFEAFRTRKQFAEIILLHTLVYQVEQIFFIHGESGIVLDHVVAENIIIQDPDLVSGMLTAIQDFVKDSFDTDDDLNTLRMGSDKSVWIEKGEHALIAAVIKGTPPLDMRIKYRELIEEIHIKAGAALEKFDGDLHRFLIFREQLKEGLQFQEKKDTQRISPLFWCILLVILCGAGVWGFSAYKANQAWHQYLSRVEAQKGLIILSAQKRKGTYRITGLRDPLAADPLSLLDKDSKYAVSIEGRWQDFYSLDPHFVFQRAKFILTPPETIQLELAGTTLIAQGQASHAWIKNFRTLAPTIPGINGVADEKIQNSDRIDLDRALKELMSIRIYFENNSTVLVENQEPVLDKLYGTIGQILSLQSRAESPVQIIIQGHTDSSGNEKLNRKLSRNRAEKIFNSLIFQGINPAFLSISGIGTKILLKEENSAQDRQFNRAVTFKTFYGHSKEGR
jgi:outer membrane protein OmpA-like peptidoglycan-associated protein